MTLSKRLVTYFAAAILGLMTALSCTSDDPDFSIKEKETPGNPGQSSSRTQEKSRNVLLLYSAGYNTLSRYLQEDIKEMTENWLPGNAPYDNILLVFSRHTKNNSNDFKEPVKPELERIFKRRDGTVVRDTLDVPGLTAMTIASDKGTLNLVLNYVKDNYPAENYGMIFSSHATGWLPKGQYKAGWSSFSSVFRGPKNGKRLMTKTIGEEHTTPSHEMDVTDFAAAFPDGMKFDYILFDACLMGGIETAYELRDNCSRVAFSQAEVLAEGFDYSTMTTRLLKGQSPDIEGVCRDFFDLYNAKTGDEHSATISLIDTEGLEALADVCEDLFETYRSAILALDYKSVQGFYGSNARWFFDLGDILDKAGISASDKVLLENALSRCVTYKGCTGQYYSALDYQAHEVKAFCGLSMYLPACGTAAFNDYYRSYAWNQATGLVK